MPRAKLTLTVPEGVWIGDLSRTYPETRFRILAALPADDGDRDGIGLVEVAGSDLPAALGGMGAYEEVTGFELLKRHDDTALVQFGTSTPLLLSPVLDSCVPLEMPFDIRDGEAGWNVTATRGRLSELGRDSRRSISPSR